MKWPCPRSDAGIGCPGIQAPEASQGSRQGVDAVIGRVDGDADDIDPLFPVRQAHPADNVLGVLMQELVELPDGVVFLHNDADHSHAAFHTITSSQGFAWQIVAAFHPPVNPVPRPFREFTRHISIVLITGIETYMP